MQAAPTLPSDIRDDLFRALRPLRAFAVSLTGDVDRADDLVQDAVVRGLSNLDKFQRGTNLQGWLFTILRNQFYSTYRKWRWEVEDPDGAFASKFAVAPEQGGYLEVDDFRRALATLSPEQREAIVLIGAEGLSYEEAAEICGTKLGTMKSRVNRARRRLAELLGYDEDEYAAPASVVLAALGTDTGRQLRDS
jgi:RNA polymerase sigma-70 factor, ECF subfamily